jgi:peptidoglycan hydrolase-like protein with peptidoglycan-binding domain
MNKKMIPIVVCLLFTFSVVNIAFGMDQKMIMDYQKKLSTLGYYKGESTGKLDEATIEAIKACQKACGMKETGKMTKGTCAAIDKAVKEKEKPMKEKAQ